MTEGEGGKVLQVTAHEITPRRRFRTLLRRERYLRDRIHTTAGPVHFFAEECSAIHWAVEELSRLFPAAAAAALQDVKRDEERPAR